MQGYCTRGARGVDVVVDVSGKFLQTFKTIIWTAKFRGDYAAPPRRPISFNSFPLPSLSLSLSHSPVSHFLTLPSLSLSSLSLLTLSPSSPSLSFLAFHCVGVLRRRPRALAPKRSGSPRRPSAATPGAARSGSMGPWAPHLGGTMRR